MFRTDPLSIIRSFSLYTQQWYKYIYCSDYLNRFGLDSVTIAFYPAFFDLKIVNILHNSKTTRHILPRLLPQNFPFIIHQAS